MAMDEDEMRLLALELLAEEILADLDPAAVQLAAERIAGGLEGAPDDERTIRLQALQMIKDAQGRFTFGLGSLTIRSN
jgi:hypothetical protein